MDTPTLHTFTPFFITLRSARRSLRSLYSEAMKIDEEADEVVNWPSLQHADSLEKSVGGGFIFENEEIPWHADLNGFERDLLLASLENSSEVYAGATILVFNEAQYGFPGGGIALSKSEPPAWKSAKSKGLCRADARCARTQRKTNRAEAFLAIWSCPGFVDSVVA